MKKIIQIIIKFFNGLFGNSVFPLRYISLTDISAEQHSALWELARLIKPTSPILIVANPEKQLLTLSGRKPLDDLIERNEIPTDTVIDRKLHDSNDIGALLFEPTGYDFYLIYPDGNNSNEVVREAIAEVCNGQLESNDVLINGKKFSGQLTTRFGNNEVSITNISFDFDRTTAEKIYKNIEHANRVISLKEVDDKLDREVLKEAIVNKIAEKLSLDIEVSSLTVEEEQKMEELYPILNDTEWINNGKRKPILVEEKKPNSSIEEI